MPVGDRLLGFASVTWNRSHTYGIWDNGFGTAGVEVPLARDKRSRRAGSTGLACAPYLVADGGRDFLAGRSDAVGAVTQRSRGGAGQS